MERQSIAFDDEYDLEPGGKPLIIRPKREYRRKSYLITGRVFDQVTSSLGVGLHVYAYQIDGTNNLVLLKKVRCKNDGSYSVEFQESEVNVNNPIELFAYQGGMQLELVGDGQVRLISYKSRYLKNLFVAARSSVVGAVKRNNYVNAAG